MNDVHFRCPNWKFRSRRVHCPHRYLLLLGPGILNLPWKTIPLASLPPWDCSPLRVPWDYSLVPPPLEPSLEPSSGLLPFGPFLWILYPPLGTFFEPIEPIFRLHSGHLLNIIINTGFLNVRVSVSNIWLI